MGPNKEFVIQLDHIRNALASMSWTINTLAQKDVSHFLYRTKLIYWIAKPGKNGGV